MVIISNNYRIRRQDKFNIIIERTSLVDGQEDYRTAKNWRTIAYCGTLGQALKKLDNIIFNEGMEQAETIEEFKSYCDGFSLALRVEQLAPGLELAAEEEE